MNLWTALESEKRVKHSLVRAHQHSKCGQRKRNLLRRLVRVMGRESGGLRTKPSRRMAHEK